MAVDVAVVVTVAVTTAEEAVIAAVACSSGSGSGREAVAAILWQYAILTFLMKSFASGLRKGGRTSFPFKICRDKIVQFQFNSTWIH